MSPTAASTGVSAKASAFDTASLFAADKAASAEAATTLATLAKAEGVEFFGVIGLNGALVKALNDETSAAAREAACATISTICDNGAGQLLEPYIVSSDANSPFPALLEAFANKEKAVKEAAIAAVKAVVQVMNPWATAVILPALLEQVRSAGKWQVKTGCLDVLQQLITSAPDQMGRATPDLIPVLAGAVWDTKADVKKAAEVTLERAIALVDNKDIEKFIPALIKCLLNSIEEVPKTINLLFATKFVSEVTAPTISLIAPLLIRGLDGRHNAIKRKVCVIADNMSKLVDSEYTVRPFLPLLLPRLIKTSETITDREARSVCNRAIATLRRIGRVPKASDGTDLPPLTVAEGPHLATSLVALVKKHGGATVEQANAGLAYAGVLAASLVNAHNYDQSTWEATLPKYLLLALPGFDSLPAVRELLLQKADEAEGGDVKFADEEEGEDLCNIEQFNLAYGAKILLHRANMRLKRGHRYGLCGPPGSGKSTLMNAISNSQVDGFPPPEEVRTFHVQHDIDGSEAEISIIDLVLSDKRLAASEQERRDTLLSAGFDEAMQKLPIGSLSNHSRVKLALARAILSKADILLFDEPTNHLDILDVEWLINHLISLTSSTSIIVSHDSDFLNRTITDVLHLNNFKLKRYPGSLTECVGHVPEAKAYFQLNAAQLQQTPSSPSSYNERPPTTPGPREPRGFQSNFTTLARIFGQYDCIPNELYDAMLPSLTVGTVPGPLYYNALPSQPICLASTLRIAPLAGGDGHYVPALLFEPVVSIGVRLAWRTTIAPAIVECLSSLQLPWVAVHVVGIGRTSSFEPEFLAQARTRAPTVLWVGCESSAGTDSAMRATRALHTLVKPLFPGVEVELYCTRNVPASAFLPSGRPDILPDYRIVLESGLGLEITAEGRRGTLGYNLRMRGDERSLYGMSCHHVLCSHRRAVLRPGEPSDITVTFRCQEQLESLIARYTKELQSKEEELADMRIHLPPWASMAEEEKGDEKCKRVARAKLASENACADWCAAMGDLLGEMDGIADADDRVLGRLYCAPSREASITGIRSILPNDANIGWTRDIGLFKYNLLSLGQNPLLSGIRVSQEDGKRLRQAGYSVDEEQVLRVRSLMTEAELAEFLDGERRTVMLRGATSGVSLGKVLPLVSIKRGLDDRNADAGEKKGAEISFDISVISAKPGTAFSKGGDSGAPVVDELGRGLGILSGGSGHDELHDISYVLAAPVMMEQFSVMGLDLVLAV